MDTHAYKILQESLELYSNIEEEGQKYTQKEQEIKQIKDKRRKKAFEIDKAKDQRLTFWVSAIVIFPFAVSVFSMLLTSTSIPDNLTFILPVVFIILLFIPLAITFNKRIKKIEAEVASFEQSFINPELKQFDSELKAIANEMQSLVEKLNKKLLFFPPDYRHKDAIAFMFRAFQNLRADTIKEAINLYETECYRAQMAELQEKSIRYADANSLMMQSRMEKINDTLKDIEKNLDDSDF